MPSQMPARVDLHLLAAGEEHLAGTLPLRSMTRLAGAVERAEGDAEVDLHFALDAERRVRIDGQVAATVEVTCQRCLEPITLGLDLTVRLGGGEDEGYEPLETTGDLTSLSDLVEDELLLGLPPAPVHEAGTCDPPPGADELAGEDETKGRENPFDGLRALLDDN